MVSLLHDHEAELPILAEALTRPALTIGALGSRRVAERRKDALAGMGLSPVQIARIHGPAGLIPSARDPGTLTISVLAEIAQTARNACAMPARVSCRARRRRKGGPGPGARGRGRGAQVQGKA